LIATGGSAAAAGELIRKAGGKTIEYLFVVGLPFLKVCLFRRLRTPTDARAGPREA
jgi:adenine/guanine phosphoribosyltransferase-like PRPP-binding protein